ncbi:MAG: barstar family protein [Clostridia bacterium]|nr:barstar family protein [Clostridia bacterium]
MNIIGYDPNAFKPIKENPIILDFSEIKTGYELHKQLKEKFGLPDYYGENWDALWDCLRYLWWDGENIHVKIYAFSELNEEWREYCEVMIKIFERVHRQTPNFTYEVIS